MKIDLSTVVLLLYAHKTERQVSHLQAHTVLQNVSKLLVLSHFYYTENLIG
jgi:hypothetical protein